MRVTKKDNAVYYMPQEVREIVTTDVTYMPVTRELLEKYFQKATKEDKRKLVKTLSKILCKWKQDSVISFSLYLDSVFKYKHKLVHNQSPV